MKKKALVVLLIGILTISISACGASGSTADSSSKSESSAESVAEETGLFSGVGGWKAEEGIIMLLETDGSGAMLSEVSYEGDTSNLNFPSVFKTDITWEEDDETVSISAGDTKYSLQKKKDGEKESLELSGVSYARLSEEELKEYKEKADSVASIDPNAIGAEDSNDASSDNSIIEFSDTILLDNDLVTVELTQFFEKEVNWAGASEPQMEKYITLKVHNNSDKEILFNLEDAYINDESVTVIMQDGNSGPAPGKTKTYSYDIQYNTSPNPKALDAIEDLYTLDANIQTYVYDGGYLTDENNTRFCINDVINGASEAAAAGENSEAYADVYAAISANTWLFNGGGDAILNYIDFKEDKASIGQVYFDGNGLHDNGVNEYGYTITDSEIIVTTDGGELDIPYTITESETTLGTGEYFSLAQIEEGLQGYWKYSYDSFGKKEGYLLVDHGTLKSESASTASGGASGDYYYYGPYEGSYTLGIGCFETDLFKGSNWYYNIINGVPTVLYYEHICVPADGFAGENGYSF